MASRAQHAVAGAGREGLLDMSVFLGTRVARRGCRAGFQLVVAWLRPGVCGGRATNFRRRLPQHYRNCRCARGLRCRWNKHRERASGQRIRRMAGFT